MSAFNLVFDVKAGSAEEAIAAVDALRAKTFGRPGTGKAEYGTATATADEAAGLWRIVQPVNADQPGVVVFDAAAAAGDTNGQISFVIQGARTGGGGGGQTASPAAVQEHMAQLEELQAQLRAAKERETALLAERDAAKAQAAAATAAPPAAAPAAPAAAPPAASTPAPPTTAPAPSPAPAPPTQAPAPAPAPAPAAPVAPAAAPASVAPSPTAPAPPSVGPTPPPPAPAPPATAPAAAAPAPSPAPPTAPAPPPPPSAPPPSAAPPPPPGPPGPAGPPGAGAAAPPPPPSGPPPGSLLAPPPAAAAPVGPWRPTHLVSGRGLPAWDQPDPTKPAVATLSPWLEVQVLDQVGAWANVLCANGWQGWVDSHQLVKRAG